jgi:hypothetical protein
MVYDFLAKIKNVQNKETLTQEALSDVINKINVSLYAPLKIKFVLPDADPSGDILIKASASISSMPAIHDTELESTINDFKSYLKEIAAAVDGEISKQDGFYNNTKIFKRLFD